MSAKLILDMNAMHENFFANALLLGISCALPSYTFCWLLNQHLDLKLTRDADCDICIKESNGDEIYYPYFQYNVPLSSNKFSLYQLFTYIEDKEKSVSKQQTATSNNALPLFQESVSSFEKPMKKVMLMPEWSKLDYLLMIQEPNAGTDEALFLNALRSIKDIQFAQVLDSTKMKNIDYLII
jgi:hypothetical protein